jgi:hypothetical protein
MPISLPLLVLSGEVFFFLSSPPWERDGVRELS